MKILIVMDSRGRGLDQFIWENYPNMDITTVIKPGYTMERLACETRQLVRHKGQVFDIICFAGGINNLTSKINQQNGFELFYMHSNTKVSSLKDCFSSLHHEFSSSFCVKFATIAPASLVKSREYAATLGVNSTVSKDAVLKMQKDLEEAVEDVNNTITEINLNANMRTIFLDRDLSVCHRKRKGKKRALHTIRSYVYGQLYDGLHPNHDLRNKWFNIIVTSSIKDVEDPLSAIKPPQTVCDHWDFKRRH